MSAMSNVDSYINNTRLEGAVASTYHMRLFHLTPY